MKNVKFLALGLVAMLAASCVTQKQLTYLQDANPAQADSVNATFHPQSEVVLRNGDAVTVFVSALDKEAVAPYNLPAAAFAAPGSNSVQTTPMLMYYTVDADGNIEMPVVGKVQVAGLTRAQASEVIKEKLAAQVLNPMVQVNLINAGISVLGEVNRPGRIGLSKDSMTIFEALAAAGDLSPYGKRDNVLVTREVNGKVEFARLNLRNTDIYNSPYFYLQQNDVVYVSPNAVRAISSTNTGVWLSIVSTALSAATVIVTVLK